jgi:hypothetical protein
MSIGIGYIVDDAMAAGKLSIDSVYTVWSEHTAYNSDILFKRNAISFDPSINLSNNAGKSSSPAIAASGNNVYVVWTDDTPGNSEIFYRRSTDGGASFGGTVRLTSVSLSWYAATMAVSENNVYLVWNSDAPGSSEIFYRKSTDGGAFFGDTVNLSNTAENSYTPRVAASNNLSL